jgi:iron-sulfur cluster insertion protein
MALETEGQQHSHDPGGHDHASHDHGHDHAPVATPATGPATTTTAEGEEVPVGLTAKAAEKVAEIRAAESIEADLALRLRVVGGGCSGFSYDLYFDQVNPEMDHEYTLQGVHMCVDQMSLMYLAGTTIDYVEGLQGAGFKFNNPNVKSTCGCGSSFSA